MVILYWIIFGLLIGAVAKFFMPGKDPGGCVVTILLGIVGAVVGGAIGSALGWGDMEVFNLRSFGMAVLGSIIILIGYRAIIKK